MVRGRSDTLRRHGREFVCNRVERYDQIGSPDIYHDVEGVSDHDNTEHIVETRNVRKFGDLTSYFPRGCSPNLLRAHSNSGSFRGRSISCSHMY